MSFQRIAPSFLIAVILVALTARAHAGSSGFGVFGKAYATSGNTYGVLGVSDSSSGTGVRGTTSATSGRTYALYGRAASTTGRGVFGYATASSGFAIGVLG